MNLIVVFVAVLFVAVLIVWWSFHLHLALGGGML